MSQQNQSRREALRQQQEMEEKAKARGRVLRIGGAILVAAVLVIVAFVALPSMFRGKEPQTIEQVTPPNASENFGIYINGKKPVDGTPHLTIYEDYLCGGCGAVHLAFAPAVRELVERGDITAEVVAASFLDQSGGESSKRAAMAAAAADVVGKYNEMHDAIFLNQSRYTEKQLGEDFPKEAGITGDDLKKYQELFEGRATNDFATGSNQRFLDENVNSTPSYVINGQRLIFATEDNKILIQPNADSLLKAITAAYKGEAADSHEPLN